MTPSRQKARFFEDVEDGDIDSVRAILQDHPDAVRWQRNTYIVDKDYPDDFALHLAAKEGSADMIQLLLDAGAEVDARDFSGYSPLMDAAMKNHPEAARMLLKYGADPNHLPPIGYTALMEAAKVNACDIVQLLLEAGADPNPCRAIYETAVWDALEKGAKETLGLLIGYGAKLDVKDLAGRDSFAQARALGRTDLAEYMEYCVQERNAARERTEKAHKEGVARDKEALEHGVDHQITVKKPLKLRPKP